STSSADNFHAYIWSPATGIKSLGDLGSPLTPRSAARGCSPSGRVVGGSYNKQNLFRAFERNGSNPIHDPFPTVTGPTDAYAVKDGTASVGGVEDGNNHWQVFGGAEGTANPAPLGIDTTYAGTVYARINTGGDFVVRYLQGTDLHSFASTAGVTIPLPIG